MACEVLREPVGYYLMRRHLLEPDALLLDLPDSTYNSVSISAAVAAVAETAAFTATASIETCPIPRALQCPCRPPHQARPLEDMRLCGESLDVTESWATYNSKRNGPSPSYDDLMPPDLSSECQSDLDMADDAFANDPVRRKRALERRSVTPIPTPPPPPTSPFQRRLPVGGRPRPGWNSGLSDSISVNSRFVWSTDDGDYYVFPETQSFLNRQRARSEQVGRKAPPSHDKRPRQVDYEHERLLHRM